MKNFIAGIYQSIRWRVSWGLGSFTHCTGAHVQCTDTVCEGAGHLTFLVKRSEKGCQIAIRDEFRNGYFLSWPNRSLQRHCTEIRNRYSQKWNGASSFQISAFMFLWAIYIPKIGPPIFCSKIGGPIIWEYINRSQIHECGNWERGRAVSFLGIHKSNCRIGGRFQNRWKVAK